MSVDIGRMLSEGVERTISRNGLLLAAIFYAVSLPNAVVSGDINRQAGMGQAQPMMGSPPEVGLSFGLAAALGLVLSLASLVVTVGAMRTFVSEKRETLDAADFTDDLLLVVVNLVVGGILFGIAVGLGTLLLVIPGLFLLTSLFFWNYHVVVEGDNFLDAFANSWELTRGNRLELFALGVLVVVINAIVGFVFSIPAIVLPTVAGFLLGQVGSTIANVFVLATASRTFVHLTGRQRETRTTRERSDPGHAVE
jgi:hypothetical protein